MIGSTHLLAGAALALLMPDPTAGALCVLGSLLPDLDAGPSATIANPFKLKILNAPARTLAWITRKLFKHRGLLHQWPALFLLWWSYYFWPAPWLLGLAAGWTGHVALDMLTRRGVALFGGKSLGLLPKWARIRTGGRVERGLVRPLLVVLVGFIGYQKLPPNFWYPIIGF